MFPDSIITGGGPAAAPLNPCKSLPFMYRSTYTFVSAATVMFVGHPKFSLAFAIKPGLTVAKSIGVRVQEMDIAFFTVAVVLFGPYQVRLLIPAPAAAL